MQTIGSSPIARPFVTKPSFSAGAQIKKRVFPDRPYCRPNLAIAFFMARTA